MLGPVAVCKRELPAFGGFNRIAGAEGQEIGNDAQGGEMFDGLMGRAIFTKADGVMGHHIDHALAHDGRRGEC